jgi:hypothetical protein
MEKKQRRKPEADQKRNSMEEKIPAASQTSGDGVLSVDETFPPRALLIKPLSPWARTFVATTADVLLDELVTIKLTNFSKIDPALIHSKSTATIATFSRMGR